MNNAGSGNISLDNADVGLNNVTNDAQIKTDGTNAPNSLKNDQISINSDGTLSNAGSGQVSAEGIGATSLKLLSSGDKPVTITGNKVSVGAATTNGVWDTQVYSKDGYDAAQASWVIDVTTNYWAMIGLNATPNTDISATNTAEDFHHLDFAWYARNQKLFVYKDGANQSGSTDGAGEGSYVAGDKLSITYDGVNAKFYKNGSLLRTIAAEKTGPFHFDSSWNANSKSISQVQFGPFALNTVDAAPSGLKNDQITISNSSGTLSLSGGGSGSVTLAKADVGLNLVDNLSAGSIRSGTSKTDVGLENVNNPDSATTPIGAADVANNIGGLGLTTIDGGLINADSTVVAGTGSNKAGLTGRNANDSGAGTADTDIRIFAGSTFANRGSAPFRVTQGGGFRAEFGHIGGFTIGSDALISTTADQPQITLGQDLINSPTKQITLSARSADDFLLYAGIDTPPGGVGIKTTDNPPFGVDKDGKVLMRSFELRDANNSTILSSDNLLSKTLLSQINSALGAGSSSAEFVQQNPNSGARLEISSTQTITIEFELNIASPYVLGARSGVFTAANVMNSIMPQFGVEVEYRAVGSNTWLTFGTQTFTGVQSAGSQPTLTSNTYWINAEEYFDRDRGNSRRAQIEFGHGCINSQGNVVHSVSRSLTSGNWEFRINELTSSSKNIIIGTRSFTPSVGTGSSDVLIDHGYGSFNYTTNNLPSEARLITTNRVFRISGTGGTYAVDTNSNPITVSEGVTFNDVLHLTGGTIAGNISVTGDVDTNKINCRGGQQLVLNAGESEAQTPTSGFIQNAEKIYLNAEEGIEINSHPANWGTGTGITAGWNGRSTAYINRADKSSLFPGKVTVSGEINLNKGPITFADGSEMYSAGEQSPCYGVQNSGTHNISTLDDMYDSAKLATWYEPSYGPIQVGRDLLQAHNHTTLLYTMYVRNSSTSNLQRTIKFLRVDDNAYVFLNGVQQGTVVGNTDEHTTYVTRTFSIPGKDDASDLWKVSRIDILKNDSGSGSDKFEMYADFHNPNASAGVSTIRFQPFTTEFPRNMDPEDIVDDFPVNKTLANF